jgi:hypothetical protein
MRREMKMMERESKMRTHYKRAVKDGREKLGRKMNQRKTKIPTSLGI